MIAFNLTSNIIAFSVVIDWSIFKTAFLTKAGGNLRPRKGSLALSFAICFQDFSLNGSISISVQGMCK